MAVRPEAFSRLTGAQAAADSYDGFDATAAEQLRQDQCLMAGVLRLGGPTMFGIAQDALNQTPDKLHSAANREYWNHTPLSDAFTQDRVDADKEADLLYRHVNDWGRPLDDLTPPRNFEAGFNWPPGSAGRGQSFFRQTGLSTWVLEQFWKREEVLYQDPTPPADDATVKALKELGTPVYGKSPDPSLPPEQWQRAYAEYEAWSHLTDSMEPTGADNARIFLSSGGFPRTAPEPGSLEFRLAVEDLKTRFAACAWRTPVDPNKVLGKELATASQEWQQEIASQAAQRNQILGANRDAAKALAIGAKALGEMLGQSWIADHLVRWQDYWSPGGPGWIGDSPLIVHLRASADKCLDAQGGGTGNGTPVQLWTCNGTGAQQWAVVDGTLRSVASGKCLDVRGAGSANGTTVQIWNCNGSGAQQWQYSTRSTTSLRNTGTGNCLDLHTFDKGRGAWMWACNGTDAQKFDIVPSGHNGTDKLDYPKQDQFDKAAKGVAAARAEAQRQLDLIKSQSDLAKRAAADTDKAEQAAYAVADGAGAPRGRGLLVGQQKAQVTKASAAALEAIAKAGETAYAATRASAGDSETIAARALTQAAASKAAFRTAAAQEANAQAKAAADAAAVQAKSAKSASDVAKAKLAETQKAESDARAAAATARAKRLAAEKEEATAKAEKETAAQKQAEAADHKKERRRLRHQGQGRPGQGRNRRVRRRREAQGCGRGTGQRQVQAGRRMGRGTEGGCRPGQGRCQGSLRPGTQCRRQRQGIPGRGGYGEHSRRHCGGGSEISPQ
nr:RICIN domain-containing protein [Streptomyces sp. UNOC14_S4]